MCRVALENKFSPSPSDGLEVDQVPHRRRPPVLSDEPVGGNLVKFLGPIEEEYDRRLVMFKNYI